MLALLLVVQLLQELVVFLVRAELQRVLVVREQSVVAVGQVSEGAALRLSEWW